MAVASAWQDLAGVGVVEEVRGAQEPSARRATLGRALQLPDTPRDALLLDLLFYALAFAELAALDAPKTSALLSILRSTHQKAAAERLTVERGFAFFKSLLLKHSVQRPPFSTGLFSLQDIKRITDYAINTYYRHYRLYQYAFTSRCTLTVDTQEDDLELPPTLPPLSDAITQDEWDRQQVELRRKEQEQLDAAAEAKVAEEAAKQKEIEDAYRAAIPEDVSAKVAAAVEVSLPVIKAELQDTLGRQEQALLARLTQLEQNVQSKLTSAK